MIEKKEIELICLFSNGLVLRMIMLTNLSTALGILLSTVGNHCNTEPKELKYLQQKFDYKITVHIKQKFKKHDTGVIS